VTRHRTPARGAHTPAAGLGVEPESTGGSHRAADAVTRPTAVGRAVARHRSPRRSALRHGAVAVGITGTALAAVAPASLQLPGDAAAPTPAPAGAAVALSARDADLSVPTTGRVSPVTNTAAASASTTAAASDLLKATDRVRRPVTPEAPAAASTASDDAAGDVPRSGGVDLDCGASGSYGGVASSVRTVGNALECVFPGHDLLGVGGRGNTSDHPSGYALDVMTTDGDQIASCVLDNKDALGVSYVIWNQRINTGSGWKGMEDRGGATANHEDHVHISFGHSASPDVSVLSSCG